MSIKYAATSIAEAYSVSTTAYVDTDSAHLAPYCPEGIAMEYINSSNADLPDVTFIFPEIMSEGWISFYLYCGDLTNYNWDHHMFALRDIVNLSGSPVFTLYKKLNSLTYYAYRPNGTSLSYEVTSSLVPIQLNRFDVHFKLDETEGEFTIYINGTLFYSYTGSVTYTASGFVGISGITFKREGGTGSVDRVVSGLIVSTEDTRNMSVEMDYPSGAGTYAEMTGTYADVDETGALGSDYVYPTAEGQRFTVDFPSMNTELNDANPVALCISTTLVNAVGVSSGGLIGIACNSNGVFEGGAALNDSARNIGFTAFDQDPNTSADWTTSTINATELGFKSTS